MTNDLKPPPSRVLGLLIVGGAAWLIILMVIGWAYLTRDTEQIDSPPSESPEVIGQMPTLAAVTPTPQPSATPIPATITPVPATPAPTLPLAPTATLADDAAPADHVPTEPEQDQSAAEPTACAPPEGWEMYVVQPGDTLFAFELGAEGAATVEDIMAANCLTSRYLLVNQVIYLPGGAAANAPPSEPFMAASELYARGPRTPACPCTISISDGWRREQIAEAVQASAVRFTGGDFLAATGPGVITAYEFANQRPASASLEGFLFPGVYTVQNDTTAEQFRDLMLAAFDANVNEQMRADAASQGRSFYEVVIIASIVQREVRSPDDQKKAASLINNRLRDGSRLGMTVTLQYALGRPGNWWPRVTDVNLESPYNSYNRPGLPPTPIGNPGLTALLAAIYPPQTNYYYHNVACDGSGEVFSETYEQHLATVNCD